MRTDHLWFQQRLSFQGRAQPARSCLLVVPPGSDTPQVQREVVNWLSSNASIASAQKNRRAAIVRVTVDTVSSSTHFVRRFGRELGRSVRSVTEVSGGTYAAEDIENFVHAAQAEGAHPFLVVDRFHAFASIADDQLLSVLSTMRQLEHDGHLTTIAISPMNYREIRAQLSEQGRFPFVNSAYGDNHDQAIMPPLTRSEFVAAAAAEGVNETRAQALFAYVGGPDNVHAAVIRAELEGKEDLVGRAARILGDSLERFFDVAIGPLATDKEDLRLRVATGQLLPSHIAYLKSLDLFRFLLKEGKGGKTVVASPVIGHLLLRGKEGPWIAYAKVLEAISNHRLAEAARQVALLDQKEPHLEAFACLVTMLAAVHDSDKGGLLEIDWKTAHNIGLKLLSSKLPIDPFRPWINQLVRWGELVDGAVDAGQGRGARLDILGQKAKDPDVQNLFGYALRVFLDRVKRSGSPGEQVRAAGSIPESILQALLASLNIDPLNAPRELPDLDYQRFFGNREQYIRPKHGARLDLTHLLVIVPALLEVQCADFRDEIHLCDPSFVKPLHQTLVANMRNKTAHTYADEDDKAAAAFFKTCYDLIADATAVWRRNAIVPTNHEPDAQALGDLMSGRVVTSDLINSSRPQPE